MGVLLQFIQNIKYDPPNLEGRSTENARAYWPKDSEEYIIEGGIHSYFGCYGIQSKDGEPAVSNEEQINETVDIIERWIEAK